MINSTFHNVKDVVQTLKPSKPVLCISQWNIKDKARSFQLQFPGTVAWAVKSNPEPMVAQAVYEGGIRNFDVASLAEIKLIKDQCPEARLHFNHPVKAPEDIREAYYKHGVRNFVADHRDEIEKIANCVAKPEDVTVLVRFYDPSIVPSSNYDFGKKFGATPEEAVNLLIQAKNLGFKTGIATHPSTQYADPGIYRHLLGVGQKIAEQAAAKGAVLIARFNIGGGFPAYYPGEDLPAEEDYMRTVKQAIKGLSRMAFAENCEFICEPGRAMVADCASLLTRVELNRQDGRLHLNDGFYGALMEQRFVDFAPPARAHAHNGRIISDKCRLFTLLGPTCDSIDILRKTYALSQSIQAGDYIEFGLMGAYTNASATRFNGFEPARLIKVDEITDWTYSKKPRQCAGLTASTPHI